MLDFNFFFSYSSEVDSERITNLVEHPIQMKPPGKTFWIGYRIL